MNVFGKHAALHTLKYKKRNSPWMTDNIKLIKLRDRALQRFKETKSISHWDYYKQLRNFTKISIKRENKAINYKFRENKSTKALYTELNKLNTYCNVRDSFCHKILMNE